MLRCKATTHPTSVQLWVQQIKFDTAAKQKMQPSLWMHTFWLGIVSCSSGEWVERFHAISRNLHPLSLEQNGRYYHSYYVFFRNIKINFPCLLRWGCGGIFFVASIFTFFHTALEDGGGEEIKGPFTCIHLHTGMEWHEIYPPTCSKKV